MKKTLSIILMVVMSITTILTMAITDMNLKAQAATSALVKTNLSGKLPLVTFAMPLSGSSKVYAYSDSNLSSKYTSYYIDSFKDQIVVSQVSNDGRAVYVTYPSTSASGGYRSLWFACDDILGLSTVNISSYTATSGMTTYRMSSASGLTTYGNIDRTDVCLILGTHAIGGRTYYPTVYPIGSTTVNRVSGVRFKLALTNQGPVSPPTSVTPGTLVVTKANQATLNYVNTKVNALVFGTGANADRVRRNLDLNKAVVFFFEGAGADLSTAKRMGALCVVVKKDARGNPYIAFENAYSTTIPDYPTNKSKNEGTAMPTVIDGIYNIISTQHRGYDSVNIQSAAVVRFDGMAKHKSTSVAINIHHRSTDEIAPVSASWVNSAGCFLVGLREGSTDKEYWNFISAIGARGVRSGNDMGVVIVDRSQATSYLLPLYNGDSTAVSWIQGK